MTLVEVAVVVIIVAVLAVIAVVGYRRYVRAGRMTEVNHMVGAIKMAQHRVFSESGAYANVSSSQTSYYPNPTPVGTSVMQWGGPCGAACLRPDGWNILNVHADGPVMFGYATVGGIGGQLEPPPTSFVGDPPSLEPFEGPTPPPAVPFFMIGAALDYDRNGTPCYVVALSQSNQIFVSNMDE